MNNAAKLAALRAAMKENDLQAYVVVTADDHQSEYFASYYRSLEWLSNFSGENSTVVVTADQALIWADGRYWISCEKEIANTEFKMMKMAWPNVLTVKEFLLTLPAGSKIGFDGSILDYSTVKSWLKDFQEHDLELCDCDLISPLWQDRPALTTKEAWLHTLEYTGMSTTEKLADFRKRLAENYAEYSVISACDDVCWLFNIRAHDIPNCPVLLSFALISKEAAYLYADEAKINATVRAELEQQGVNVLPYWQIYQDLEKLPAKSRVYLESSMVNYRIYQTLATKCEIVDGINISTWQKAVKNPVEIKNIRETFIKDSAAICKFMAWLDKNIGKSEIKELDCAAKLLEFRKEQTGFIEESFATIPAFGPNAAMLHYAATEADQATLEARSFFLHDSGGQYYGGTTDITRTQALGPLTAEEKFDYTYVTKSCIDLLSTRFLRGTTGHRLDGISRYPLWQIASDYKSGTGHGVGYCLNVHEGPQSISSRRNDVSMQLGMLVTVEPGVYKADKHGIRIENDVLVVEDITNDSGEFYRFEIVSFVPFESRAILVEELREDEREWLNQYHAAVYEKIAPLLNAEEQQWLANACKAI